jgi:hypothetical protein
VRRFNCAFPTGTISAGRLVMYIVSLKSSAASASVASARALLFLSLFKTVFLEWQLSDFLNLLSSIRQYLIIYYSDKMLSNSICVARRFFSS